MRPIQAEYRDLLLEIKRKKPESARRERIPLFMRDWSDLAEYRRAVFSEEDAAIHPAVMEYLEDAAADIPPGRKITIEIEYGEKIPRAVYPDNPRLPEKMIKKSLEFSIYALQKKSRRKTAAALVLALAGVTLLGFINKIPFFDGVYAVNELFVVVSWVFIWRFVEMFFFERPRLLFRRVKLLQLHLAEYKVLNGEERRGEEPLPEAGLEPLA